MVYAYSISKLFRTVLNYFDANLNIYLELV